MANFTANTTSGCTPLIVDFLDQSVGNPTSWYWDFGNGATSTLKNPSTTYFIPGTYTVKLTVKNAAGQHMVTRTGYITIFGKPSIAFTASDSTGCFPKTIQFTDQSTASTGTSNTAWFWDFGDGSQGSGPNPSHTYITPGNFTVTLKVTNNKGCSGAISKVGYIQLNSGVVTDFGFVSPNRCNPPFPITFTNNSAGSGTLSYQWDFGDGGSSTAATPSHTYTTNGTYTVRLITTSSTGCRDTLTKLNLFNFLPVSTTFSAPDTVCINDSVHFINTSTPAPAGATWSFGDGNGSNVLSPVKSYATAGLYTVKLVNDYGHCTDSVSRPIRIAPKPVASFTASDTFKCQPPFTVQFTSTSTGATAWSWDFGDGNTSSQQNPSHTYNSYGSFTVKLVITSAAGCTDSITRPDYIRIVKPVIQFTGLPQRGCIPYNASFGATVTTQDNVTSYNWNFGDGNSSSAASPTHVYTVQGIYTVILTITTSTGCTIVDSFPQAVKVGNKPQTNFSAVPNPVCAFQAVQFTDLSSQADEWQWIFGDGASSSAQNPQHTYTDTGWFNVTLIAYNFGCGDTLSRDRYIRVKPPIAKFRFVPDCSDRLKFSFVDESVGATGWSWNFGDGNNSSQQSPVHSFPALGTYTVTLTATNDACSHSISQTVKVINEAPDFTRSPAIACKTATVSFNITNANTQNLVSYDWDFGNGTNVTVGSPSTTHTYTASGSFNASVVTKDIYGCTYSVPAKSIRINGPTASFTEANTGGCKGFTASFTNQSQSDGQNGIVSWKWVFGDGNSQTVGSGGTVQHTYPVAGTYSVQLVVTDAAGCKDSLLKPDLVHATAPQASFAVDTLSCPGSPVQFHNTSTAVNFTSSWFFGDGGTSPLQSPSHVYADTGSYTIRLVIVDGYGCPDTVTSPGLVKIRRPKASFEVSDSVSSCSPFQVMYTNTSTFYNNVVWNLAGGSSAVPNPVQVYVNPGQYTIRLYITSPGGCQDSAIHTVHLYDTAGTKVTYTPLDGCKPLDVSLTATSNGHLNYTWDFGDGVLVNDNANNLHHVYNFFGNFVPKLIMTDASGCVIPVTGLDTIRIIGAAAKFGLDKKFFCDSGQVNFIDSTTFNDAVVSYHWDFGDGNISTQQVPSHHYANPGLYTITLSVQTEHACVDTFRLVDALKIVESPLVKVGGDSVICLNEYMKHLGEFLRVDTSQVRWQWSFPNGRSSALQNPEQQQYGQAGTFPVTAIATNSSGCKDTAVRSILVNPLPVINLPSVLTKQAGFPLTIPATYSSNVTSYNWTPANTLNCSTCPQPVSTAKLNTSYTVSVVDSNSCRNKSQVRVVVTCPGVNVFLPNTFSPNADGSNDVFFVRGYGLARVKTLRIFNRWGEIVFEANNFPVNDANYGWNGKYKGQKPVPDVYVYQLEVFCENSEVVRFEGNVALLQ